MKAGGMAKKGRHGRHGMWRQAGTACMAGRHATCMAKAKLLHSRQAGKVCSSKGMQACWVGVKKAGMGWCGEGHA